MTRNQRLGGARSKIVIVDYWCHAECTCAMHQDTVWPDFSNLVAVTNFVPMQKIIRMAIGQAQCTMHSGMMHPDTRRWIEGWTWTWWCWSSGVVHAA